MDKVTGGVIVAGTLATALVFALARYRSRGKARLRGMGFDLGVEGGNETPRPPGVAAEGLKAGGDIRACDASGQGVSVKNAEAKGDIDLSNKGGGPRPKK